MQDRGVGDRDELFGPGVRDRPEPSAGAAGEDEAFHDGQECRREETSAPLRRHRGWRADAPEVVEDRLRAGIEDQHRVAVLRHSRHRELVLVQSGAEGFTQGPGSGDRVETGVHPDSGRAGGDQLRCEKRVGLQLVDRGVRRLLEEVLLTSDAAEVRGRIGAPLAVAELLVVAAPGVLQRLQTVERVTTGLHVEPGVLVARRVQEADLGPSDGIDEILEAVEVDVDDVMDRDAQCLGDRGGEDIGAVAVGFADAGLGHHALGCRPAYGE